MKLKYLLFGLTILAIQGCSLKVQRNIFNDARGLPPQDINLPIIFFTDTNNLPPNTTLIGRLFIGDAGGTIKCDSATVFNRARVETRKAGGNALLLTEYKKPSMFGSSCHQIRGTMLYVPEFSENNDTTVITGLSSSEEITTPQKISATPQDINRVAAKSKERNLDIAVFRGDLGYAWRTAKSTDNVDDLEKHIWDNINTGLTWALSGEYFFNDKYGVGFSFNQYSSSFDIPLTELKPPYRSGKYDTKSKIMFIGPTFVGRDALGKDNSWILFASLGVGYIGYETKHTFLGNYISESGATVGTQLGLGIDHKFNDNWGIGATALLTGGIVTTVVIDDNGRKQTFTTNDRSQGIGLGQIAIQGGIRYFINPPKKKNNNLQFE